METEMIIGGKPFRVKYENGIVSLRPEGNIGWLTAQTEPIEGLDEAGIMEVARQSARGLGLI
ncbi:hypothetical protein J0X14_18970 [Muricauda sp. CAU 1633]|uniref:hypothetical protein n=1 Tax=Allomuricauda sp. CAU 1633 TaxID=2816036 RepID=UPI001A8E19A7|nr:hypothetical protein [Muricauda sp. CAU 1633]MBO0324394.1 hypothetical protein [Muricauda sp. CAU 1633]